MPLVFGDCERLVVLAVVAYPAGAAGSSVRANFSTEESKTVSLAFRFKTEPKRCEQEKHERMGKGVRALPFP